MKKIKFLVLCASIICSPILAETNAEIFREVRNGDKEAIKRRINNSENLSEKDSDGNTVLHVAAENGHAEIVDDLTTQPDYSEWGNWLYGFFWEVKLPNKDAKDKEGKTALHKSIENGHINTADKLLSKGADASIADDENITPIFSAVKKDNPSFLPLFIKYKVIEQRINGENMLHVSIKHNKLEMVANLAQNEKLVYQENNQGQTPAMLAAYKTDTTILRILKAHRVNLNARNSAGRQAIHAAGYAPSTDTAKYLLENGAFIDATDNEGNTPLLHSVMAGNKSGMEFFLAYKADAKKTNIKGKGIITLAVENKRHEILNRLKDHPDVNINERDNQGRTAFMNATIAQNHTMMKDLIACGVDVQLTNNKGENPIHEVARIGDLDGFAIIVKDNLDLVDKVDIDGESPLFIAVRNGKLKMVKTFIYHNASLQRSNKNGETVFHRAAQCKKKQVLAEIMNNNLTKANITQQANNGLSAIHYAAGNNNLETMQEFTKYGASYTDCTKNGDSVAHTAAFYGATDVVHYLKKEMPLMLQHRNKDKHTPFIIAAQQGKIDVIKLVFCENDIMNGDDKTAINLARHNGHQNVVSLIKEAVDKRMDECVMIHQQPQKIKDVQTKHQRWDIKIIEKDRSHIVESMLRQSSSPQCYSVNDLWNKTEAERAQIYRENTRILEHALQEQTRLEQKHNTLIFAEQAERIRQENEQIAAQNRAQAEQNKRLIEQQQRKEEEDRRRFEAEQKASKELNEENAALKTFKEQSTGLKEFKEQQVEIQHYNKQKQADDAKKSAQSSYAKATADKAQADPVAAQQKEFDYYSAQKAKNDEKARQERHNAALEKQQPHVPMNLQTLEPSAPLIEAIQCAACQGNLSANPISCTGCNKKSEGICNACFKKYDTQCPNCWNEIGQFVHKAEGECCIGIAACTEDQGVTAIPCDGCKIGSDRICKTCLNACIKKNTDNNQPNRCPHCGANTLNETLVEKIRKGK